MDAAIASADPAPHRDQLREYFTMAAEAMRNRG
jgi:hypothetical protein